MELHKKDNAITYADVRFNTMKKIKNLYNNSKLQTKLMIIFGVTAVLPILLILCFSAVRNTQNMTKKVDELMTTNLIQIAERVNLNLEVYTNLAYQIYQDEEINKNIKTFSEEAGGYATAYNQISKRLKQYNTVDAGVRSISVVCANGNAVVYDFETDSFFNNLWNDYADLRDTVPYQQAIDQPGMVIIPTMSFYDNGEKNEYFHIAKRIYDLDDLGKGSIATIIVSVDADILNAICNVKDEENLEHGINFIMSDDRRIIAYPDMDFAGIDKNKDLSLAEFVITSGFMKNKVIAINSYQDKGTGWTFYHAYDQKYMLKDVTNSQRLYMAVGFAALLMASLAITIFVRQINVSVNAVVKGMQEIQTGDLEVKIDIRYHDEIGRIAENFNIMTERVKNLIQEVKDVTAKQKNAEIRALEAQINPHFLYNTLDSINWMAIENDQYEISRMIRNLGIILRYSVNKSNSIVSVEMVEDWLEKYMSLQQMRFENKFDFLVSVEERAKQKRIHKLLLQPFIENAILHGLKEKEGMGRLCVDISLSDDQQMLHIIIEDNGKGMPEEERMHYNDMEAAIIDDGRGIGLHNVFARIRMYYGADAAWNITSFPDMGTVITLRLPTIQEEEQ